MFSKRKSETDPPVRVRRRCDLVLMVVVSDEQWVGIEDLLDSFDTYLDCDFEVVAMDDASTDGTYQRLLDRGIWVARNSKKVGFEANDYTVRRGFFHAWSLFDSPVYVKFDPDALVIGHGLRECLVEAFAETPGAGIAGTYRIDWNGHHRDLSYWKRRMERYGRGYGAPFRMAKENGYQPGDGVQGGCYGISNACLTRMANLGFLDKWRHRNTSKARRSAEDSILTMLVHAAGFTGVDIGGPGQAFGLWYRGLPMSPEELLRQNRVVTHQIRFEDEESLRTRAFFREKRLKDSRPERS